MAETQRFDKGFIKGTAIITPEGYLRANAIVTRCGVFKYKNKDGSTRRELRHPDDVFRPDSLETLKMIPITYNHPTKADSPDQLVHADNAERLSKGLTGETVTTDGLDVLSSLQITHKDTVSAAKEKGIKDLSCGYTLNLIPEKGVYNGERYDYRQTDIKYNHIAVVESGRAGNARINIDAADAVEITEEEVNTMPEHLKKISLDGVEYEAEAAVIAALTNARKDNAEFKTKLDDAGKAKSTIEAERDTLKERADALEKENKSLKEKSVNQDAINAAVKARVALEKAASANLDEEALKKLDSMTDLDIKKAVIMKNSPSANLDGKDEVYIQARFDAVLEMVEKAPGSAGREQVAGGFDKKNQDSKDEFDADKAKQRHADSLKNAWKKEEEK